MIPFSPSSIWRVSNCTALTYLPRKADGPTPAATRGTGVHAFLRRVSEVGRDIALAEVPINAPHRSLCEAIDVTDLGIDWSAARAEMALALDLATGKARELPSAGERDYSALAPTEIAGTPDLVEVVADKVRVDDFKTGRPSRGHALQIDAYALMAAKAYDRPEASVRVIYLDGEGNARIRGRDLGALELDAVESSIRALAERVASDRERYESTGVASVNPGGWGDDWCDYCECKAACPAWGRDEQSLVSAPADWLARFEHAIATDDGAALAWERLPRLEEIVSTMRARLTERAKARPIVLSSGVRVGPVTSEKRMVADARLAYDVLAEMCGSLAADSAVESEPSTTLAKIKRASGKAAEAVLAEMIRRGAVAIKTTTSIGEMPRQLAEQRQGEAS